MKKMLIIYYTWAYGNTKKIADQLQAATGADIERIDTVEPYPSNYQETYEQGYTEVDLGKTPDILETMYDIDDYDVVALGTPTWWYKVAPAMLTFISTHGWKGKTVIPFTTCAGWPKKIMKQFARECEGTKIVLPFIVKFDRNGGPNQVTPQSEIDHWIAAVQNFLETGKIEKIKQKKHDQNFFQRLAATFKKKKK
ncbi:MAG: NAD(P)H-dependent oxidoreductase [Clostridia bacterium]|nr:NAD(P)H-dependent oxidoreductase [Clostridia bacterium]